MFSHVLSSRSRCMLLAGSGLLIRALDCLESDSKVVYKVWKRLIT